MMGGGAGGEEERFYQHNNSHWFLERTNRLYIELSNLRTRDSIELCLNPQSNSLGEPCTMMTMAFVSDVLDN